MLKSTKSSAKQLKLKILVFALILIGIVLFLNGFYLVDVEKVMLIEAISIDYVDNRYEIACQVSSLSSDSPEKESPKLLTSSAPAVAEAIDLLQAKTGWFPKLNFCVFIALGNSAASRDIMDSLGYFFQLEQFSDSCLIAVSETTGKELLSFTAPLDNVSGYAFSKIFAKGKTKIEDVISRNLKDVMTGYYSESDSFLLPLVTAKEETVASTDACIVRENRLVGRLDTRDTAIYNLLFEPSRQSAYYTDTGKGVTIEKKKVGFRYRIDQNGIAIQINLSLLTKNRGAKSEKDLKKSTNHTRLSEEETALLRENLTRDIQKLYGIATSGGNDFLNIRDNLLRYKPSQYRTFFTPSMLKNLTVETDIRIKSV